MAKLENAAKETINGGRRDGGIRKTRNCGNKKKRQKRKKRRKKTKPRTKKKRSQTKRQKKTKTVKKASGGEETVEE